VKSDAKHAWIQGTAESVLNNITWMQILTVCHARETVLYAAIFQHVKPVI
jgi:hypothetical protein